MVAVVVVEEVAEMAVAEGMKGELTVGHTVEVAEAAEAVGELGTPCLLPRMLQGHISELGLVVAASHALDGPAMFERLTLQEGSFGSHQSHGH